MHFQIAAVPCALTHHIPTTLALACLKMRKVLHVGCPGNDWIRTYGWFVL